jgi:hypothetical protein
MLQELTISRSASVGSTSFSANARASSIRPSGQYATNPCFFPAEQTFVPRKSILHNPQCGSLLVVSKTSDNFIVFPLSSFEM